MSLLMIAGIISGCGPKAPSSPPVQKVTAAPAQPTKPAQPGFLERTTDATWNVMQAPVKWVTPAKKTPKAKPVIEDLPAQPADAIIVQRMPAKADVPGTQPSE